MHRYRYIPYQLQKWYASRYGINNFAQAYCVGSNFDNCGFVQVVCVIANFVWDAASTNPHNDRIMPHNDNITNFVCDIEKM